MYVINLLSTQINGLLYQMFLPSPLQHDSMVQAYNNYHINVTFCTVFFLNGFISRKS